MSNRRCLLTVCLVLSLGNGNAILSGQEETRKLEMTYEWGAREFDKELAEVAKAYEAAIRTAQAKRAEGIRSARARHMQSLKFLNVNPDLPQSMREKINEDMKRIAALPEPVAPEIEEPAAKAEESAERKVSIKVDTPDSGWSIQIMMAKIVNDELWVLSGLNHSADIATMVITPVEDAAIVDASADLPVRHFVLNKTWDWENKEEVKFIRGVPDLGRDWALGKIVGVHRE